MTHPAAGQAAESSGHATVLLRCRRLLARADLPPRDDVGIMVDDGRVAVVEPWAVLVAHVAGLPTRELDGVVLPGMVDAHSHLRGLALSEQGIHDTLLERWLLRLRNATALPAGDEALVAATDLLGTGVTSVQGIVHLFAGPADYAAQVGDVIEQLGHTGIRAEVMIGLTDQAEWAPPAAVAPELNDYLRVVRGTDARAFGELVLDARRRWAGPLTRIGAAPVAPQWCSDAALRVAADLAQRGVRLHTHLLESRQQRRWLGEDPVSRLARWELLGPHLSVAHAVWLEADEQSALASAQVVPVHCPSSNAGLQVGVAHVRSWLDAGLTPALGLDSHPQDGGVDVFAEMRAARATADALGQPLTAEEVLSMATTGGAGAIGRSGDIGQIRPGFSADLVAVDLPVNAISPQELVRAVVDEGRRALVSDVFCAGEHLVHGGVPRTAASAQTSRERLRRLVSLDAESRAERQRLAALPEQLLLDDLHGYAARQSAS